MTDTAVNVNVTVSHVDDRPLFNTVNSLEGLSSETREATVAVVRAAMNDLTETLDVWLPESFVASSGHTLDVVLSVEMAEIEGEVVRLYNAAIQSVQSAREELLSLREALDD